MRLRIGVHRHTLPPINFVYNTESAVDRIRTVSDLLTAVNAFVPLESSDGEWGLEDYTVEVETEVSEKRSYECLHFQSVQDILREDDEVIIRGISSEELRERRQGGRLQITSDGRHLVDGVAWGKRWRPQMSRPGVNIPPRKRRRLLASEEEVNETETAPLQLQVLPATEIGTFIEDEDEDDQDYGEHEDSEDDTDEDHDEDKENIYQDKDVDHPFQAIVRQEFDDADEDESEHSNDDDLDAHEVGMLLSEAADLVRDGENRLSGSRISETYGKRKREIDDDGTEARKVTFEGFASTQEQAHSALVLDHTATSKLGPYAVESQVNGSDVNGHKVRSDSDASTGSASSSGSSESDLEETSSEEKMSEPDSDDDTSSDSGSNSSSNDQSTSDESDEDSDEDSETGEPLKTKPKDVSRTETRTSNSATAQTPQVGGAPGTGTKRTRQNNDRMKRRKRLQSLKVAGILPVDAGFDALRAYDESPDLEAEPETEMPSEIVDEQASSSPNRDELRRRKEELIARLNADSDESGAESSRVPPLAGVTTASSGGEPMSGHEDSNAISVKAGPPPSAAVQAPLTANVIASEMTAKRARLDIASSRRMLFSSLGLRTPKTKAAEDALRGKLAQSIRKPQTRPVKADQTAEAVDKSASKDEDSWRRKLIISAVECIHEGVVMPRPPFPFKQSWQVESELKKSSPRRQSLANHNEDDYHEDDQGSRNEADEVQMSDAVSTKPSEVQIQGTAGSRTLSSMTADNDDWPMPKNLNGLPPLVEDAIRDGAIIVFKQLHMNAKFEPEESPHRVARVTGNEDGIVNLILSKQHRVASSIRYDDDTGERILHGLDAPDDEGDEEDDGVREVRFEEMIQPKLVKAAIASTNTTSDKTITQQQEETSIVPESNPNQQPSRQGLVVEQLEVNKPSKHEIITMIKDAEFNSTLDDGLLESIAPAKAVQNGDGSHFGSRRNSSSNQWISSPVEAEDSMALDTSQLDGAATSPPADEASPPTISIIETVDYPHVSHLEVDTSHMLEHPASSSYQDAQRISPEVPDVDYNNSLHSQLGGDSPDSSQQSHHSAVSLPSEVAQSQDIPGTTQDDNEQSVKQDDSPFLGLRGGDGRLLSHHDEDATDSDGLPSLHAITASQQQRSTSRVSLPSPSPPPLRKGFGEAACKSAKVADTELSSSHASDLDYTPKEIKISQSQNQVRLTQLPAEGNSIVDLTLSSPAAEPSSENDEEHNERVRRKKKTSTKARHALSGDQNQVNTKTTKAARLASRGSKSRLTKRLKAG